MSALDVRALSEGLDEFLAPALRELRSLESRGRLPALAVRARDGSSLSFSEYPTDRDLDLPRGRVALFAATTAISYKAAKELGVLVEGRAAARRVDGDPMVRALDVAALELLERHVANVARAARERDDSDVLRRCELARERMAELRAIGRAALDGRPVPDGAFELAPHAHVESVFGEPAPGRSRIALPGPRRGAGDGFVVAPGARRRVTRLAVFFGVLAIAAGIQLRRLLLIGAPPQPSRVEATLLHTALPGSHVLPAQPADPAGYARVVVGGGWEALSPDERRAAIFALAQALGTHAWEAATFYAPDGATEVARWQDTRISLTPR